MLRCSWCESGRRAGLAEPNLKPNRWRVHVVYLYIYDPRGIYCRWALTVLHRVYIMYLNYYLLFYCNRITRTNNRLRDCGGNCRTRAGVPKGDDDDDGVNRNKKFLRPCNRRRSVSTFPLYRRRLLPYIRFRSGRVQHELSLFASLRPEGRHSGEGVAICCIQKKSNERGKFQAILSFTRRRRSK